MARISRTGTTDSTGVASTTVTGTGGGRLKFISRNGDLWSNTYEVTDCQVYETVPNGSLAKGIITHQNSGNSTISISDEWATVGTHSIKTTLKLSGWSSYRAVNFAAISKKGRVEFDYDIENEIRIMVGMRIDGSERFTPVRYFNGRGSASIDYDFTGYTGDIQRMELRFQINRLTDLLSTVYIDNIRIYPVFSAPKHYTPISLSSSASIIQTGETATLSAELTNVLGEKLANKSVNFIEKVEHLYENTSEVSQAYNSGQNVTVLSPSISRSDLGTSWTLSFDLKTDCESRVFIGNSASAVATNPQYSIFMGRDTSNVIAYGFRTTTTTVSSSSVASTSYHSCKIVFNNGTITYYVDDTQVGTKTVSFYGNYDNYVVGLVAWGTGTLYVKNIVLDNGSGGDILIGTGTTNSQGIATCNNTITGTGKGERQFIASNSSILSEIYEIQDYIRYFDGTSNTGEWSGNVTATATNDGVHLTSTQTNTFLLKDTSQLFIPTNNDFCIEFTGKIQNVCAFYISTSQNTRGTQVGTLNALSPVRTANYKFEWSDGVMKFYINDALITTTNLDLSSVNYCGICFVDWQNDLDIYLKDFKVYPL